MLRASEIRKFERRHGFRALHLRRQWNHQQTSEMRGGADAGQPPHIKAAKRFCYPKGCDWLHTSGGFTTMEKCMDRHEDRKKCEHTRAVHDMCDEMCRSALLVDEPTIDLGREIAENTVRQSKHTKYIVDFFAGCGGFTAGAALSGYMVPLIGFDVIVNKLLILKRNFPNIVAAKYFLDLSVASDRFSKRCDCVGGHNCAWKPRDADVVLTFIFRAAVRKQFPDDDVRAAEAERIWTEEKRYPEFMHPIHLHGSPSCRGVAANTNKASDWKKNVTMTTMGWFTSFVHYTSRRFPRMCDSLSLEEAPLPRRLDKDWSKMNANQKIGQAMNLMVTQTLGAKQVHMDRPLETFDPDQLYWCNFRYAEDGGMPANGERLIMARGWDLTRMRGASAHVSTSPEGNTAYRVSYNDITMADVLRIGSSADEKLKKEHDKMMRGNHSHALVGIYATIFRGRTSQ